MLSNFFVVINNNCYVTAAVEKDYPAIIMLWELSVRATHHFLPEEYLQEIKALLPSILPQVSLYVYRSEDGSLKGFAGILGKKIEMLFIHPASMGHGIGRLFIEFCLEQLQADKVDVNEQNEKAVGFYQKMGFRITGRRELDSMGRPFPLLLMQHG